MRFLTGRSVVLVLAGAFFVALVACGGGGGGDECPDGTTKVDGECVSDEADADGSVTPDGADAGDEGTADEGTADEGGPDEAPDSVTPTPISLPFAVDDHFFATGRVGDADGIDDSGSCPQRAGDQVGQCHAFTFTPGTEGWGGVFWQFPEDNDGTEPGLPVEAGATAVTFWAWGATGGEVVSFAAGYASDGFEMAIGDVALTDTPEQYMIDLSGTAYTDIAGAFGWSAEAGVTIYIDDIEYTDEAIAKLGCTDADAANYDATADEDDGSCEYDVTFNVDMSGETLDAGDKILITGSFNAWCADCDELADGDADGVWSITMALAPGEWEYRFTINGAGGEETVPDSCGTVTGGMTNRVVTVVDAPVEVDAVPFGGCSGVVEKPGCTDDDAYNYDATATSDDGSCTYEVTFAVDMSDVALEAGDVVYLNGSFNAYCGSCDAMSDGDGDGVYELTMPLAPDDWTYQFAVNDMGGAEDVPPPCGVADGDDVRRRVTVVDAPIVLDAVAFGGCPAGVDVPGCTDDDAANYMTVATVDDGSCTYEVTFAVDMNGETLQAGDAVHLTGDFNLWCGDCAPMDDSDGDGIYELTVALPTGDSEYKFAINGAGGEETVPAACGVTDGGETNRSVTVVNAPFALPPVVFGACPGAKEGCMDDDAANFDPTATADDGSCLYAVTFSVDVSDQGLAGDAVVYVNGTFNDFCGSCAPLEDPDGDGIWTGVLNIAPGNWHYRFTVNGTESEEVVLAECGENTANGTMRKLTVVDAPVALPTTAYGGCPATTDIHGCPDEDANNYDPAVTLNNGTCTYDVIFSVDMSGEGLAGGDVVNVSGDFNGWCSDCVALEDGDGDGIWTGTASVGVGEWVFYFNINGAEAELVPQQCSTEVGGELYRALSVVDAPVVLQTWVFNGCGVGEGIDGCMDDDAANYDPLATVQDESCVYDLTLAVDMSDETLVAGDVVYVMGRFNDWCGTCTPMQDADGDGIWEATVQVASAEWEYKFAINDANGAETVPEACGKKTLDEVNRVTMVADAPAVAEIPPFGGCPVVGCTDDDATNYEPAVQYDDGSCTYSVTFQVDMNGTGLGAGEVLTIRSDWNEWCTDCDVLTDNDGDGIYTLTTVVGVGEHVYLYVANGPLGGETVPHSCAVDFEGQDLRSLEVVDAPIEVELTHFGTCPGTGTLGCPDPDATNYDAGAQVDDGSCTYDVTFSVDVSAYGGYSPGDTVYLNGGFNDVCGDCAPMDDTDGDGVWTLTVAVPVGHWEYLFTIDGMNDLEVAPPACAVNDNHPEVYLRVLDVLDAPQVLPTTPWSGCP